MKYCLPVIKNSKKEVFGVLNTVGYDYFEVWLSYIKDLDDRFVVDIAGRFKGKLIFLFRRQNLEKIRLTVEKRQQLISLLSKFSHFLDIDFLTQYEDLEFFCQNKGRLKLILSFHDYKQTPRLDYLENLINKMKRYDPDIYKIATLCQTEKNVLTLLHLLVKLKEQKLKVIILGMGKKGQIVRIIGSLWGNQINFAPANPTEISAKGQLTRQQLELILKEIK